MNPSRNRRIIGVLLAAAYLIWSGVIAFGAGFVGAVLNCSENTDKCIEDGFPPLVQPWTWGDYDVFPEVFGIALVGLAAAAFLLVFVLQGSRRAAAVAFAFSVVLLSYPFFAGLTEEGAITLLWGVALGLGAVATTVRGKTARPSPN